MQLSALDEGRLVLAGQAHRQQDYCCLECGGVVRLRGGTYRQDHFYHLKPNGLCRLNGKSLVHLQVQNHLKEILGDSAVLEHRFSEVGRIADVAWLERRLVFEVQCSPISVEEVKARIHDYSQVGFGVVWIFHDHRYNKWRISAAEAFLRGGALYFTNINAVGEGVIYDQFDLINGGRRWRRLEPLPIEVSIPKEFPKMGGDNLKIIQERQQRSIRYFGGDMTDRTQSFGELDDYIARCRELELEWLRINQLPYSGGVIWGFFRSVWGRFSITYQTLFRLLLERACR